VPAPPVLAADAGYGDAAAFRHGLSDRDLGVVAIDGGRWEIYIGGAAGAHVRKGDLLATVGSADEVITLTGRFLQYYRENANWLERTYAYTPLAGQLPAGSARCHLEDVRVAL